MDVDVPYGNLSFLKTDRPAHQENRGFGFSRYLKNTVFGFASVTVSPLQMLQVMSISFTNDGVTVVLELNSLQTGLLICLLLLNFLVCLCLKA